MKTSLDFFCIFLFLGNYESSKLTLIKRVNNTQKPQLNRIRILKVMPVRLENSLRRTEFSDNLSFSNNPDLEDYTDEVPYGKIIKSANKLKLDSEKLLHEAKDFENHENFLSAYLLKKKSDELKIRADLLQYDAASLKNSLGNMGLPMEDPENRESRLNIKDPFIDARSNEMIYPETKRTLLARPATAKISTTKDPSKKTVTTMKLHLVYAPPASERRPTKAHKNTQTLSSLKVALKKPTIKIKGLPTKGAQNPISSSSVKAKNINYITEKNTSGLEKETKSSAPKNANNPSNGERQSLTRNNISATKTSSEIPPSPRKDLFVRLKSSSKSTSSANRVLFKTKAKTLNSINGYVIQPRVSQHFPGTARDKIRLSEVLTSSQLVKSKEKSLRDDNEQIDEIPRPSQIVKPMKESLKDDDKQIDEISPSFQLAKPKEKTLNNDSKETADIKVRPSEVLISSQLAKCKKKPSKCDEEQIVDVTPTNFEQKLKKINGFNNESNHNLNVHPKVIDSYLANVNYNIERYLEHAHHKIGQYLAEVDKQIGKYLNKALAKRLPHAQGYIPNGIHPAARLPLGNYPAGNNLNMYSVELPLSYNEQNEEIEDLLQHSNTDIAAQVDPFESNTYKKTERLPKN